MSGLGPAATAFNYDSQQLQALKGASIPPPVGGLNARDELANMDPRDALILDNIFPQPSYASMRGGYVSHATGMSGTIKTLMQWGGGSSNKLKAGVNGKIYDVTSAGAVGAAEVSGLSVDVWQWCNFATAAGTFLVACNGTDAVRNYDGTSWTSPSITGPSSSAAFIQVVPFKSRLWFVEKNTQDAWYLPTTSIAGAATKFPLGGQFKLGGKLQQIGTLSKDAGDGSDDYLVFLSSKGEMSIWQGTDPSSATTFALVGNYRIGTPVGPRAMVDVAGDLGVISSDGVVSVNVMMRNDRASSSKAAITDKIQNLFNYYVTSYGSLDGWMPLVYPRGNWALFNIPLSSTQYVQLVMNAITGAWCRFTNMNAYCWGLLGDDIYFGGTNGTVYKADTGYTDNSGVITASLKTAWNYFGQRGKQKLFTLIRPVISTNGQPSILMNLNVDFQDVPPTGTISAAAPSNSLWGIAQWGTGVWAGDATIVTNWNSPLALGYCGAVRMTITSSGSSFILNSFDVQMQAGGAL